MMPCELCGFPLDTREAMPQCWGHQHSSAHVCAVNLYESLLAMKDREARVSRVYWLVRDDAGHVSVRDSRAAAFRCRKWFGGKIYRVTRRRKRATKEAGR